MGLIGSCIRGNQAPGMQGPYVWIPGQGVEPGPIDAMEASEPGSRVKLRLAGEAQIERFSGAWLGACELRVRGSYAQRASMQEQPIHLGNQSTSCSAILHAHRQPNGGHLHAQDLAQWSLAP